MMTLLQLSLRGILLPAIPASILFAAAGTTDIPRFRIYLAVLAVMGIVMMYAAGKDLLTERFRPGPGARDQATRILAIPVIVAHLGIAGLDAGRMHWSDSVPAGLQVLGLVWMALGMGMWGWAMHTNRFFSSVIRIQTERGHTVITGGPYRLVRHPGYAAAVTLYPASALALGSWWAMLPAALASLLILRRLVLEDRVLQDELPGYREYAGRVRYRIAPGIW